MSADPKSDSSESTQSTENNELLELRRFKDDPEEYARRIEAVLMAKQSGLQGEALEQVVKMVASDDSGYDSVFPPHLKEPE